MKRLLAALIFIMLVAPATAQDFDAGVKAYIRHEFAAALREFRPLAERGNASAQYYLGEMYQWGQVVPQDYAEAVKWYLKAAEQGNALGQLNLGIMYAEGQGVPQDYAEAARWYRLAADKGNANAHSRLGLLHIFGNGVLQDFMQAHMRFNIASAMGGGSIYVLHELTNLMSPAQIAEAERMVHEWLEAHPQAGCRPSVTIHC